ncbi:interleukin-1 receptor-associated kinase 1-binding protein 1 isoform X3 [Corvus cornix cornix]|uniref:interleukin-1 receptor-associated kinase 1-binding protein 1 isoform X3 n=1 Tax=Corvus cornix cornix TaxID=932674 RepID=UPI001950749F|nr:interleukin-1 receptor-associated kinase 1-binding protein 1 isoform X3 [Corvus cornix cornix]
MAPPAPPPSRVFAELDLAPAPAPEGRAGLAALPGREVHVSGSAELSARPDRARVSLRLGSRKEAAVAARSSVSRRLQYIAHSARLHGVPEENMTVTEDFSRVENTYQMEAEAFLPSASCKELVCIIFSDFGKMQSVCNLLIEKLGTSVTINPPHFYHTPEAIDTLRPHDHLLPPFFLQKWQLNSREEETSSEHNATSNNQWSQSWRELRQLLCVFI